MCLRIVYLLLLAKTRIRRRPAKRSRDADLDEPSTDTNIIYKKIPRTQTQDGHDVFDGASQDRLGETPQDGLSDTPQDGHDAPDDTAQDGRDPSLTPPPNAQLPINSPPLSGILLSPFIEQAPPSRCVWVDDNSDEEGGYAALLHLATATPTTSPAVASTAINGVVVISDDESPITSKAAIASTSVIVISDSDSEDEYFISDIELTDATVAELDGSYTPLVFPDSDDEYDFSDIELTDALIAELDMIR